MDKETTITASSGNVFADLGFDSAEAQVLAMRADLMVSLEKAIRGRKLKQEAVGEVLGVSQSRVSDLMRHKVGKFSLDMLVTFAAKLKVPATLVIKAPKSRKAGATYTVKAGKPPKNVAEQRRRA
jgi:predicted XRE-type DNA-binding protein